MPRLPRDRKREVYRNKDLDGIQLGRTPKKKKKTKGAGGAAAAGAGPVDQGSVDINPVHELLVEQRPQKGLGRGRPK